MKRVSLIGITTMVLLFSTQMAWAQNAYIAGHGGLTILQDSDNIGSGIAIESEHRDGWNAGGALGWRFSPFFRAEFEFSYRENDVDQLKVTNSSFGALNGLTLDASGDISARSYMGNIFWEFANILPITPYVMAGAGVAEVNLDNVNAGNTAIVDDRDTVFAYQFGGGVSLGLAEHLFLTADYRYFATEDPEFSDSTGATFDSEYESHNISGGLRFEF